MDIWATSNVNPRLLKKTLFAGLCLAFQSAVLFPLGSNPCWGQMSGQQQSPLRDLKQLSLEQLMNIEVTSVAKKEQAHGGNRRGDFCNLARRDSPVRRDLLNGYKFGANSYIRKPLDFA
jgi:hypothetical protein